MNKKRIFYIANIVRNSIIGCFPLLAFKEIQNIEKIPNEKLPDVIIDALLKNTKNDWYNGNSTSIEE